MYKTLSKKEREALALLQTINHDTLWGVAIKNVVTGDGGEEEFRRLVSALKSQAGNNSQVMQSILGHAYDAVIQL